MNSNSSVPERTPVVPNQLRGPDLAHAAGIKPARRAAVFDAAVGSERAGDGRRLACARDQCARHRKSRSVAHSRPRFRPSRDNAAPRMNTYVMTEPWCPAGGVDRPALRFALCALQQSPLSQGVYSSECRHAENRKRWSPLSAALCRGKSGRQRHLSSGPPSRRDGVRSPNACRQLTQRVSGCAM